MAKSALELSIEEDEKLLAQEKGNEDKADDEPYEPVEDEEVEDDNEVAEEEPKEEPEVTESKDDKPVKTPAEWAEERRKAKEAKQKPLPVVEQPTKQEIRDEDPEPNKAENYEGWLEWKDRQLEKKLSRIEGTVGQIEAERREAETFTRARKELETYENKFKQVRPDYDEVVGNAYKQWVHAIRVVAPRASDEEVSKHIMKEVFTTAGTALAQGEDPAEAIYLMAVERFGVPQTQTKAPEKKLPDLKTISKNQRKGATSLMGGQSRDGFKVTKEAAAEMSLADFSKLTAQDLYELEAS